VPLASDWFYSEKDVFLQGKLFLTFVYLMLLLMRFIKKVVLSDLRYYFNA